MPVAMPTCRKVLLIPEPIPARCGGTTPTAVEASGGLMSPTPTPAMRNPGSRTVQAESASSRASSSSAIPIRNSPPLIMIRTGTVEDSLPAIGATKNDTSVVGRKRRPACSGE